MRSQDLDTLADRYDDCLIAAFADISTGVTLRTSSGTDAPREELDELCGEAALTLGGVGTPALGSDTCHCAIKRVAHALFIFLRSPEEPGDALIFMCRDTLPMDAFLADARACLASPA